MQVAVIVCAGLALLVGMAGAAGGAVATMNPLSLQFAEFEGDAAALRTAVESRIAAAKKVDPGGRIVGLIVPHAGYRYSGGVAAAAYRQVSGESYDVVLLLGLSHRYPLEGISFLRAEAIDTPLGRIPVDRKTTEALLALPGTRSTPEAFAKEHSVEVQLPFLQAALEKFSLVMGVAGRIGPAQLPALAEGIARVLTGKRVLLVASTDMSHYHGPGEARAMDLATIRVEETMRWDKLYDHLYRTKKGEMCGGEPTCVIMEASRLLGAEAFRLLTYQHSGDVTGETAQGVVGYQAALLVTGKREGKAMGDQLHQGDIGPEQQAYLLSLARRTIEAHLAGRPLPAEVPEAAVLKESRGCFVTLEKHGSLRGCIGNFQADGPLYRNVMEMAVEAATRDPRFPPVKPFELPALSIEISALTPLRTIASIDEIRVGRDGIYVIKGRNRGVLLPQVAVDYGWDRDTFLSQTCVKAGLPPDAWRKGDLTIQTFTAQIFSEGEKR
jgi:hypothetical protein